MFAGSGGKTATLEGHTGRVNSVAFSRDGTRIVSGSSDETIRLWSSETGQSLSILKGHTNAVNAVTFSPDGTRIVSGSTDKTIRIWSSGIGQSLSILEGHTGRVNSVIFSRDGTRILSGSDDQTIQIWSSKTGQSLLTLGRHTDWVYAVAVSPDDTRIVSGSNDRTVRIWSSETDQPPPALKRPIGHVDAIAFSLDGTCVATGADNHMIGIWSLVTGELLFGQIGEYSGPTLSLDARLTHFLHPPSSNSSTVIPDFPATTPTQSTHQPPRVNMYCDRDTGWITLSSGTKPVCILPTDHADRITISAQSGSVLVLGYRSGKFLILDFSRISDDTMTTLAS